MWHTSRAYDQVALHQLAPSVAPAPSDDDQDGDAWERAAGADAGGRSRLSLVGEMTQRRSDCLALLSRLPEKELRGAVWFPGEARRSAGSVPLRLWLERWSKHDMVHGRAILRATTTLGPQSDFENWLRDDPVLEALDRSAATQRPDGES